MVTADAGDISAEITETADEVGEVKDIWLRCEWCGEVGFTETIKTAGSTDARMKERCIDRESCRTTVQAKMGIPDAIHR